MVYEFYTLIIPIKIADAFTWIPEDIYFGNWKSFKNVMPKKILHLYTQVIKHFQHNSNKSCLYKNV